MTQPSALRLQVAPGTAHRKSLQQPAPKMGHPEKFGNLQRQRELSAESCHGQQRHTVVPAHPRSQSYRHHCAGLLAVGGLDQPGFPPSSSEPTEPITSNLDRDLSAGDPVTKVLFECTDQLLREPRL